MAPLNSIALPLLLLTASLLSCNAARISESTQQLASNGSDQGLAKSSGLLKWARGSGRNVLGDQAKAALEMLRRFISNEPHATPAPGDALPAAGITRRKLTLGGARSASSAAAAPGGGAGPLTLPSGCSFSGCGGYLTCNTGPCSVLTATTHIASGKTCANYYPTSYYCFSQFPSEKSLFDAINPGITTTKCDTVGGAICVFT